MALSAPVRILGLSLLIALAIGGGIGVGYALVADKLIAHGLGFGWFTIGLMCLGIGLLGAVEPPQGWRSRQGRRSMAFKVGSDVAEAGAPTTVEMLLWGLFVGGSLIGASLVAFYVAAS